MTSKTLQLFIAVNQDGEFKIDTFNADDAIGELQDEFHCEAMRTILLNVTLDLPAAETLAVAVPAQESAPAQVTVAHVAVEMSAAEAT